MKKIKNSKNKIFPVLALIAGVAFTSCEEKLDIEQKGTMSTENLKPLLR